MKRHQEQPPDGDNTSPIRRRTLGYGSLGVNLLRLVMLHGLPSSEETGEPTTFRWAGGAEDVDGISVAHLLDSDDENPDADARIAKRIVQVTRHNCAVTCSAMLRKVTILYMEGQETLLRHMPRCITSMALYNPPADPRNLRSLSLHQLYLGLAISGSIHRALPETLEVATLWLYNEHVGTLPRNLTQLTLGDRFNQAVSKFPPVLEHLTIGNGFRQPLTGLPGNLKTLVVGNGFNQKIDALPPCLEGLALGDRFNNPIDRLPTTLMHLYLGFGFSRRITTELVNLVNLTHLIMKRCVGIRTDKLPPSLIELALGKDFNDELRDLPPGLLHLTLGNQFNRSVDHLPHGLLELTLTNSFDQPVDNLPATLTHLVIGDRFDQPVDNLPDTLTFLMIGDQFDQAVDNLPPNLACLTLGNSFDHPVDKLPPLLRQLTVGELFDQPLTNLPPGLTHLTIPHEGCFDRRVDRLPETITYLKLPISFDRPLDGLPKDIKHLVIDAGYSGTLRHLPPSLTNLTLSVNDLSCRTRTYVLPPSVRVLTVHRERSLRLLV